MRLSAHFELSEFVRSQTATRFNIYNWPGQAPVAALRLLCRNSLESIREHFGKPIIISSGYRCVDLNRRIGGSRTSQHIYGQAADFYIPGIELREIFDTIRENQNFPFDQLILEGNEDDGWIHLSYRLPLRREAMRAYFENGAVSYIKVEDE